MTDTRRPELGDNAPPATSVLFDVFALGQAVHRLLADAMNECTLSPEDYAFYSAIFEPEQITPTALAARLGMPLTTVMDRLGRVEARGHAHRFPDPQDRRASLITLTADGLAAHREANRSFERAYGALIAELPHGESVAKADLERLRGAVERAHIAASVAR
jgi:DNA-binding MarR family transcriptional regulator